MVKQFIVKGLILLLFILTAGHISVATGASVSGIKAEEVLLQFKSGSHILGFTPEKMYLVGMGYVLIEEFEEANKVAPVSSANAVKDAGGEGAPPSFTGVEYKGLWRGITLKYIPSKKGLTESIYVIEPGGDARDIRLRYNTKVGIQKDGKLRFALPTERGYFTQSAPIAWQEVDGNKKMVEVSFRSHGDNTIGFHVGEHDRNLPLIIDPTYEWHTFYGAAYIDAGYGIAVDSAGNVYITGYSSATWGTPLNAHSGGWDITVLKLNNSGVLEWHTFHGSGNDDYGYGIAVDGNGNVYITGESYAAWGSPVNAHSGGYDIVVLKLNNSGALQWNTFHGSSSNDFGNGITVEGAGNVYVTGLSYDTWGLPVNPHIGGSDIVTLKLNNNGDYQWHTFHGSSSDDYGNGITVDALGNVYVTGYSSASWGLPVNPHNGSGLVVLKLNSNGCLEWHTFYSYNYGNAITVDALGNVYVTGYSSASWGLPVNPHSGGYDIVVLKLNNNGDYQWHTFHGSASSVYGDYGYGITSDSGGNVYIVGLSKATWGIPLNPYRGYEDIVILRLDSNGQYQWHTFYGAYATDSGYGIAVDSNGNVYVTGKSSAGWGLPVNPHSGSTDVVVLKLTPHTQYTLTVTKAGSGNGTVSAVGCFLSWTGNIGTCKVNHGAAITLIGSSDADSSFTGWSGGGCSGTGICSVVMNADMTVMAEFVSAPCNYSINSSSATFGSNGGTDSVKVTTPSVCKWSVSNSLSWVSINTGASGTGSGTVTYSVASNTGTSLRSGSITIAGKVFYINQEGGSGGPIGYTFCSNENSRCNFTGTKRVAFGSNGKFVYKTFTNGVDCKKSVFGDPNPGAAKACYTKNTGCVNTISPFSKTFSNAVNTALVSIKTSSSSCTWTAISNAAWITITSGSSGTGSGTVGYSISANTGTISRTGTITAAGRTFTITQDGIKQFNLTVSKSGDSSGTVTSVDGKINCGSACSSLYNAGASATLTASSNSGSIFSGWSGGGCSGTGSCAVVMNANMTVTAEFASSSYIKDLTITAPQNGAVINSTYVMVRGTVAVAASAEPLEIAVTANGVPAEIYNNNWVVNEVPLTDGANTITVIAKDENGGTITKTISVTKGAAEGVKLTVDVTSGVSPFQVNFSASSAFMPVSYQMDFHGDGIIDYTGAEFEDITYTYTAEGIYYPTLTVTDSQGNAYTDTIAVTVLNKTKLDALLKKKWEGMTSSLGIKDTSKALTYISSATRASYQQMFDALKDNLPAIIATKREFNLISVMGNAAKYELITFENAKTYSYEIIFIREKDGFWVIQDF